MLEPHQACAPHLSPGFLKHLFQTHPDASCSDSATGNLCVCSLGHTLVGPFCSPVLLHAAEIFSYFSAAKGEKKTWRQLLLQGILAAGATLAPWGLRSCREGDTECPPCSCASSCNPLAPQKTHQADLNPSQHWLGRKVKPISALWAQGGRFSSRGVKLQIPPTSSLQQLLLALSNLLVLGVKFQH